MADPRRNGPPAGLIRHLFSIAALPFTMAVFVPIWLARRYDVRLAPGESAVELGVQALSVFAFAIGVTLFVSTVRRFATEGRGTLAPWDPPRALVVHGPYRYVRNPMISGVLFVLIAEAMALLSVPHAAWATAFLVVNAIYIPAFEEPQLERRFGESYREYCRHVRRFVPRLAPWTAGTGR